MDHISKEKKKNKTKAHEMSVVNSAEPEFAGKPHHFHINNIPNVCFLFCVMIIASSSRLNVFILHWFEFSTGGRMRGKKKQNMMFNNKLFVPENLFFGNLIGVYLFTAEAPP